MWLRKDVLFCEDFLDISRSILSVRCAITRLVTRETLCGCLPKVFEYEITSAGGAHPKPRSARLFFCGPSNRTQVAALGGRELSRMSSTHRSFISPCDATLTVILRLRRSTYQGILQRRVSIVKHQVHVASRTLCCVCIKGPSSPRASICSASMFSASSLACVSLYNLSGVLS